MILQSLVEFSRRERLVEDPLFSFAGVSWAIDIGANGEFLELIDLRTESQGKGAKKKQPRQFLIPKRPIRPGQQTIPAFLVDNAEYVLGLGDQDELRRNTRRARFAEITQNAALTTADPGALAAVRFLSDDSAVQAAGTELQSNRFASQELICFEYEGDYLHDSDSLKAYWRQQHSRQPGSATTQCLVCGTAASMARLHTPIKYIPGASTAGVPLVSFNQSAFCSYGWEQNENAPVCESCVSAYSTALNRCLSSQFPNPRDPESSLSRQAYTLGTNLTAVYWSDGSGSGIEEAIDPYRNPQIVKALLETPYHRSTPSGHDLRFHCLLLQGTQGRATVRSYITEPIADIQHNLLLWFEETEVGLENPLSLVQIMSSLAVKNELKKLPINLAGELYLAVLLHRRIPYAALHLAVTRNRVEADVRPARAAFIQAWKNRENQPNERTPSMKLDPECASVGYQLGRLLAVCDSVQYRKTNSLNKTLVDRYFSAMSTRPALVMGALLRLTKQIQSQIPRRMGSPPYLDFEISEILARVEPNMPSSLELKEQANFALGFYHQKQFRKSPKESTSAIEPETSLREKEND